MPLVTHVEEQGPARCAALLRFYEASQGINSCVVTFGQWDWLGKTTCSLRIECPEDKKR